jgi:hypothetical protein
MSPKNADGLSQREEYVKLLVHRLTIKYGTSWPGCVFLNPASVLWDVEHEWTEPDGKEQGL